MTYTSVRQQMLDEEVRSSLAQLQRQGVDQLARLEIREWWDIEVARAADAQATMQRRTSNLLARMQLLEAEQRAALLLQEQQDRDRVTWESGWASRRGDMSIWEGRCRTTLLGICPADPDAPGWVSPASAEGAQRPHRKGGAG